MVKILKTRSQCFSSRWTSQIVHFSEKSTYVLIKSLCLQWFLWLLDLNSNAASDKQNSLLCIRAQRRVSSGRTQWNRPSCEFMIAPLDWPRPSGTANARALGAKQPPLPPFTQKHMLFSVFTPSLSLTKMRKHTTITASRGEVGSTYRPFCSWSSFLLHAGKLARWEKMEKCG